MNEEMRALRVFLANQTTRTSSIAEERRRDRAAAAAIPLAGVAAERVSVTPADGSCAILHFHAGAYVYRSALEYRPFGAALSRAAAAAVYLVDYRLAPEHPFPAAFDDAFAAYRALLAQGIRPDRLVVSGDSAGGELTLALLAALRDGGMPLPAAAVLMSPWADLTCASETYATFAAIDPRVTRPVLLDNAAHYLAGADPRDPRASPVFGRLHGLPPLLVLAGSDEVMLGDALGVYGAVRAAGGEARLEVWPDMIHVWHLFSDRLAEGRRAIEHIGAFAREQWVTAR